MLTKEALHEQIRNGIHILDGATGSNLMQYGIPKGACMEQWIMEHPDLLLDLQSRYAKAGSQIIYAPTFQAQPIALARAGMAEQAESVNARLVALTKKAAPGCLVAGNLTTLAAFLDSWDEEQFDLLVENYSRQIRGLIDGGADLLAAETLMYPLEAEAILTAAELEGAGACMYTFTMQSDGSLYSGRDSGPILQELEAAGAAAVGFNCVAADMFTPSLVSKLRRYVKGPLVCKPNAGNPTIGTDQIARYGMMPAEFAKIMIDCRAMGATLIGGCCGTTPEHIGTMCAAFYS